MQMCIRLAIALSVAVLAVPLLAEADPAQPQTAQSAAPAPVTATATPVSPTPAPAAAVGETVKVTAPTTAENLDEVVCKVTPPETGSRLGGSRECRTVREWKLRQQESQDMLERSQGLSSQPLRSPSGTK
jgi:hypothetical protein